MSGTTGGGTARRASGLALGASAALLADPLAGLADTAAAGHLGVAAQAALAVGAAVTLAAGWLLNPLLFAQTTDVARAVGAGDLPAARRALRSGLLAGAALGTVLGLLAALLAEPVVAALTDDAALRGPAVDYLRVRALVLPVVGVVLVGHGALRGAGDVRGSAALALGAAGLHAGLDAAVVTLTDLGLGGLATTGGLAQVAAAAVGAHRLRRRGLLGGPAPGARPQDTASPGTPASGTPASGAAAPGTTASDTWALVPLVLRSVALSLSTLALATAAARLGPEQAAAHQVTYQVWLTVVLALEGWKAAAQILVARTRDPGELGRRVAVLTRGALVLGAAAAALVLLTMPVLPAVLGADAATAEQARRLWPLAAASLLVGAVAFTRDGVEFGLGGYGRNLARTAAGMVAWLGGAAVALAAGDLVWVWVGVLAGLAVRAIGDPLRRAGAGAGTRRPPGLVLREGGPTGRVGGPGVR